MIEAQDPESISVIALEREKLEGSLTNDIGMSWKVSHPTMAEVCSFEENTFSKAANQNRASWRQECRNLLSQHICKKLILGVLSLWTDLGSPQPINLGFMFHPMKFGWKTWKKRRDISGILTTLHFSTSSINIWASNPQVHWLSYPKMLALPFGRYLLKQRRYDCLLQQYMELTYS